MLFWIIFVLIQRLLPALLRSDEATRICLERCCMPDAKALTLASIWPSLSSMFVSSIVRCDVLAPQDRNINISRKLTVLRFVDASLFYSFLSTLCFSLNVELCWLWRICSYNPLEYFFSTIWCLMSVGASRLFFVLCYLALFSQDHGWSNFLTAVSCSSFKTPSVSFLSISRVYKKRRLFA